MRASFGPFGYLGRMVKVAFTILKALLGLALKEGPSQVFPLVRVRRWSELAHVRENMVGKILTPHKEPSPYLPLFGSPPELSLPFSPFELIVPKKFLTDR